MKKIVITGGLGYIGMELCKVYSGESRNYSITRWKIGRLKYQFRERCTKSGSFNV